MLDRNIDSRIGGFVQWYVSHIVGTSNSEDKLDRRVSNSKASRLSFQISESGLRCKSYKSILIFIESIVLSIA